MLARLDAFLGPIVRCTNVVLLAGFAIFILFVANPIRHPNGDAETTFQNVAAQLEADRETDPPQSESP